MPQPPSPSFPTAAPTPLEHFALLVSDDTGLPLTEAAICIAQVDHPDLDVQGVLARIDALAHTLRRRLPADAPALHRLRTLNRWFFEELGFGGNVNDYYDPANSYLHRLLDTRRGIPISLAVLYIEIAQQVGLQARGIAFPGHFLVKLRLHQGQTPGEVVIDPFTGQSLSRHELDERLRPYRQQQGLPGEDEVPLSLFLQAATARSVLVRMLRNLKEIHRFAGDAQRLHGVCERLVVLLPDDPAERRDRGKAAAEIGQSEQAVQDLRHYLEQAGDAADRPDIERLLASLAQPDAPTVARIRARAARPRG